MANNSFELLKAGLAKRGIKPTAISPQAEEMCKLLDHYNEQHWHDRNALQERIKRLEAELGKMKSEGQRG